MAAVSTRALIDRGCRKGLDGWTVELQLKGEPVIVTAAHFDAADTLDAIEALPLDERRAIAAALVVAAVRPEQARRLEPLAASDPRAAATLEAVVLCQLCRRRRQAVALARAALGGDPRARAAIAKTFDLATSSRTPAPVRRKAHLRACMLREALSVLSSEPAPPTEQQRAPSQAAGPQDMSSAAIAFDAEGNPYVVGQAPTPTADEAGAARGVPLGNIDPARAYAPRAAEQGAVDEAALGGQGRR